MGEPSRALHRVVGAKKFTLNSYFQVVARKVSMVVAGIRVLKLEKRGSKQNRRLPSGREIVQIQLNITPGDSEYWSENKWSEKKINF